MGLGLGPCWGAVCVTSCRDGPDYPHRPDLNGKSTHANVQKPHEAYGVWTVSNTLMIIVITNYLFLINYILKLLVFPTKTGRYSIYNYNRK